MRPPRIVVTAVILPGILLGTVGCTAATKADANPSGTHSTSSAGTTASAPPTVTLAGSAEARSLAPLPAGPATGTAVLAYSGVGEVRAPFRGRCSHSSGSTHVEGSADTARITVDVTPEGARLSMKDVGLAATSELTTGRYSAAGRHLSIDARLAHDAQPIGSVQLEVDCG
jgi:hypothetical protein